MDLFLRRDCFLEGEKGGGGERGENISEEALVKALKIFWKAFKVLGGPGNVFVSRRFRMFDKTTQDFLVFG